MPLMAQAQCRRLYGTEMGAGRPPRRVRDDMICAGYPQGLRDTCKVRGGKGQRSGVSGHGVMGEWGCGVPMGFLWGLWGSYGGYGVSMGDMGFLWGIMGFLWGLWGPYGG